MKVMIIGCGRVGSVLANRLDEEGHRVIILDRNQQAFRRLSEKFSGEQIVGNGLVEEFVRPTLQEKTDILFAMTDKDNINLMIAQRVKRHFDLGRVVAVVHDSILAGLYKELGVETVCPTDLVIKDLFQTIKES
ncbi:MAG TPA: NAD-binding protein [Thermodesulfobacteriota bacterium]|jgi:trk system potassium uptake protein TrkA|nr:NAD-binding protein [Thermodesulfobacteriota bacterium]